MLAFGRSWGGSPALTPTWLRREQNTRAGLVRICVWMHHKPWGFKNTTTTISRAGELTARSRRAGVWAQIRFGQAHFRAIRVDYFFGRDAEDLLRPTLEALGT